jgi:xanthine/uracil permease
MSESGTSKAVDWVVLIILLIIGVSLVPTVVDTVQGINTTNWSFTGYTAASTLMGLLPFIFIVGLVIYFLVRLLRS